jgi:hypothetical protein
MKPMHPAQLKALLRRTLTTDIVLTTAQLERRGLREAAQWLALPSLTLTCRTRVTQSESTTDLTFVALTLTALDQTPRDLMHLAGLAEARSLKTLAEGEVWRHIVLKGRIKHHQADAEIVQALDSSRRSDWAVEFDAGYSRARTVRKLIAAAQVGYTKLYWATSIHDRARSVMALAAQLQHQGRLPYVSQIETRFVNFWSASEPYLGRPRCHKPLELFRTFSARGE